MLIVANYGSLNIYSMAFLDTVYSCNYILKQKRPCAWLPGGDGVPLGEDVGLGLDPGPDLGLAVVVGDPLLAPAPRLRLLSLQLGLLVLLQLLLRLDDVELVALGQHLHAPAILVVLEFL